MESQSRVVQENESEEIQTAYDKGRELEFEFSNYMKTNLNWHKIRVGAHLPGRQNSKGSAVDVIGESLDERGQRFAKLAISWMMISGGFILLSFFCIMSGLGTGVVFLCLGFISLGSGFYFKSHIEKYNKMNAWVECKNLKGKTNINQIDKSLREKRDYLLSGDTEYKFTHHYFVSANGYVENALKYAKDNNIFCFEKKKDGSFSEVQYWN